MTTGATAELQKYFKHRLAIRVPLEMLRIDRGVEERAAATVPANDWRREYRPRSSRSGIRIRRRRIFGHRAARSVPVGDAAYPVLSTVSEPSRGLSPTRIRCGPDTDATFVPQTRLQPGAVAGVAIAYRAK